MSAILGKAVPDMTSFGYDAKLLTTIARGGYLTSFIEKVKQASLDARGRHGGVAAVPPCF